MERSSPSILCHFLIVSIYSSEKIIEQLLEKKGLLKISEIEGYQPSTQVLESRANRREIYLSEILRIIEIELEAESLEDNAPYSSAVKEVEEG